MGQKISIAGDELTIPEALEILSESMGRSIDYEQLPDEQLEEALGHDVAVMFRWINQESFDMDIPALEKRWGIPLTRFRDMIAKAVWTKAA